MRIAVVHEWLTRWSGSEAVLEQILAVVPQADLFAITSRPDDEGLRRLAGRAVRTSFVQHLPGGARWPQAYLGLLPLAAEQFDLRGYDLVISNSHAVAKGVIAHPDARHVSYIHSPMRYAWDLQHSYQARVPWPLRPLWAWQMHRLRAWERGAAMGPDTLVANSAYIAHRIRRAWRREAEVLHPPVEVAAFTPGTSRSDHYVTASRLVPYKQVPAIAQAFAAMPQRRLVVIGDGPDLGRVQAIARTAPNVQVLGHVPRARLVEELRSARAFVFAAEEDFGIAPVEALACGTPVIAYGRGGAAETVIAQTGAFFHEQSPAAIAAAVAAFEKAPAPDPVACRVQAERFAPAHFRDGLRRILAL